MATCLALGAASLVIMPFDDPPHCPVPSDLLSVVTSSMFLPMLWCIMAIPIHICILRQWLPPHELFMYDYVGMHWIFTVESLGLACAGVGLVYSKQFRHSYGGQAGCRIRCELSSWLALAMAAAGIVDVLVLRWATRRRQGAAQAGHTSDLGP